MKRYTFEVVIDEGNDEFWEEIEAKKSSGCDEVLFGVKSALANVGWDANYEFGGVSVTLKKFEEIEE